MRWTKHQPTQNGWYWYRPTKDEKDDYGAPLDREQIVEIRNSYSRFPSHEDQIQIEDLKGEWAGPIEAPST